MNSPSHTPNPSHNEEIPELPRELTSPKTILSQFEVKSVIDRFDDPFEVLESLGAHNPVLDKLRNPVTCEMVLERVIGHMEEMKANDPSASFAGFDDGHVQSSDIPAAERLLEQLPIDERNALTSRYVNARVAILPDDDSFADYIFGQIVEQSSPKGVARNVVPTLENYIDKRLEHLHQLDSRPEELKLDDLVRAADQLGYQVDATRWAVERVQGLEEKVDALKEVFQEACDTPNRELRLNVMLRDDIIERYRTNPQAIGLVAHLVLKTHPPELLADSKAEERDLTSGDKNAGKIVALLVNYDLRIGAFTDERLGLTKARKKEILSGALLAHNPDLDTIKRFTEKHGVDAREPAHQATLTRLELGKIEEAHDIVRTFKVIPTQEELDTVRQKLLHRMLENSTDTAQAIREREHMGRFDRYQSFCRNALAL